MGASSVKVGLITNPLSQRNKKNRGKLGEIAKTHSDVVHEHLEDISAMAEILDDFSAREVGVIALDGGDGTVQAALTELLNGSAYEMSPLLCTLPSGMTNLIAGDVGGKGPPEAGFSRLIDRAHNGALDQWIVERHVIRMQYKDDMTPIYGMFFGAGAVTRAIELCRRTVHRMRLEGSSAVGLTMVGLLLRRWIKGSHEDEVFRGDDMVFEFDGSEKITGHRLLVLTSTLKHLVLGTRPFWGEGEGSLQVTSITYPPARFWRSLIPLLYGNKNRNLDPEIYLSRKTDRLAITMNCLFTLDGELFEPTPGTPVCLETAGPVRFIRW